MTLVDVETGEVAVMSESDARALIDSLKQAVEIAERQIIRAWEGRAWLALGYESWDEMAAVEFSSHYIKIAPDERRAKAIEMAKVGMSTRAIGSALGVSKSTISDDLRCPESDTSPDDDRAVPSAEPPEAEPSQVTGLDGKTYPKPAPKPALTREEQRAIDIEEGRARHARNLERLISLWPWIDSFATDPYRDDVLGRLTDHDRQLLDRIEARITGDLVFTYDHKEVS